MQTLKAQAQAGPRSFSEIQQDPLYVNADAAQQALAAQEYFNQYVATQNAYKQAKPEQQKAAFNEFVTQYNIPMPDRQPITTGQGFQHKARPQTYQGPTGFNKFLSSFVNPNLTGGSEGAGMDAGFIQDDASAKTGYIQAGQRALAKQAQGASFGYLKPEMLGLNRQPLADPKTEQTIQNLESVNELAGALLPIELTANLANRGLGQLQTAGQRLAINQNVPRYLQGIAEKSVPYLRNIGKEIGKIGPIGRSMLEQGLGFGLYESAKAREGADQFDPMGRAVSGIEGFGIGALGAGALGLAGKGVGAAYGQLKNIFADTAAPASLGRVLQGQVQKTGEASIKYLESTAQDLQNLLDDIFANNAQGKLSNKSIKKLSTVKERMGRAAMGEINLTTAEVRAHRSALNQIRREVKYYTHNKEKQLKAEIQALENELIEAQKPTLSEISGNIKPLQAKIEEFKPIDFVGIDKRPKDLKPKTKAKQIDEAQEALSVILSHENTSEMNVIDALEAFGYSVKIDKKTGRGTDLKVLIEGFGSVPVQRNGSFSGFVDSLLNKFGKTRKNPTRMLTATLERRSPGTLKEMAKDAMIEDLDGNIMPSPQALKLQEDIINTELAKRDLLEAQAAYDANKKANEHLKQAYAIKTQEDLEASYSKVYNDDALDIMPSEFWEEFGKVTSARKAYIEQQKILEQGRRAADKISRQRKSVQRIGGIQGKIEENRRALEALKAEAVKAPEPQAQPKATQAEPIKGTVAIDAEKGIYLQKEIDPKALTYEQVADKIQNKAVGEKLANAMKAGESVRVEYKAEITGRTDKAVTITAKGNIKEATTTFTPAYFKETKNGKIMVQGYNEQGHFRSYHLDDTESGSVIVKVGKQIPEAFRGEYPNIYKGQREFNINDLTARAEVKESVLTSEAMNNAKLLKDFTTGEAFTKLPKPVQSIMKGIQKRGRFTKSELAALQKELNKDLKQLEEVCQIMGIK